MPVGHTEMDDKRARFSPSVCALLGFLTDTLLWVNFPVERQGALRLALQGGEYSRRRIHGCRVRASVPSKWHQ